MEIPERRGRDRRVTQNKKLLGHQPFFKYTKFYIPPGVGMENIVAL